MKNVKILIIGAAFLCAFTSAQAQEKNNWFGVYVNPAGFLQFGPTVGAEYTFMNQFSVGASYRIPQMGMLTTKITDFNDQIDDTVEAKSGYGLGLSFDCFFKPEGKWYTGIFGEYWLTRYRYEYSRGHQSWPTTTGYLVAGKIGFRHAFSFGLFLRTALYAGATFTETTYYGASDEITEEGQKTTLPVGMLEISLGFRF